MNYLDIIFIVILAFFIFQGWRKGFVKTIGGILGLIVGIYFAGIFYLQASQWLQGLSNYVDQMLGNILGFVLIFIIANRLFAIVIWMLDKIVKIPVINSINKILGLIFGLLEGFLIVALIFTLLTNFQVIDEKTNIVSESKVAPYIESILKIIKPLLPEGLEKIPKTFFDKSKDYVQDQVMKSVDDMTIDELIDYLNEGGKVQQNIIEQIKANALEGEREDTKQYIIDNFKQYLETLDSI